MYLRKRVMQTRNCDFIFVIATQINVIYLIVRYICAQYEYIFTLLFIYLYKYFCFYHAML